MLDFVPTRLRKRNPTFFVQHRIRLIVLWDECDHHERRDLFYFFSFVSSGSARKRFLCNRGNFFLSDSPKNVSFGSLPSQHGFRQGNESFGERSTLLFSGYEMHLRRHLQSYPRYLLMCSMCMWYWLRPLLFSFVSRWNVRNGPVSKNNARVHNAEGDIYKRILKKTAHWALLNSLLYWAEGQWPHNECRTCVHLFTGFE